MKQLDNRISMLRLRLAEVKAREEQLAALHRQFGAQMNRIVDFAVYERSDLDAALSMIDDVETRQRQTDRMMHHLEAIKGRIQEELNALILTRDVESAKVALAEMEERSQQLEAEIQEAEGEDSKGIPGPGHSEGKQTRRSRLEGQRAEAEAEVRRLRQVISDASEEAARAVASTRRGME